MSFKLHKESCNRCQNGYFCDDGLSLLQNKEKFIVTDDLTKDAEKLHTEIAATKKSKIRLTRKQKWRQYKNKMRDKVGNKFHRV